MKLIFSIPLAATVALNASAAAAQAASLSFQSVDGCPSRDAFVSLVARRGGSFDARGSVGASRVFVVALRKDAEQFAGALSIEPSQVEKPEVRTIRAATCQEVAEALSIAVALELHPPDDDPRATRNEPAPSAASEVEASPAVAPAPELKHFRGRSSWGPGATQVTEGTLRLQPEFAVTLSMGASFGLFRSAVTRYDATFRMASFVTLPSGEQKIVGPILRARLGFVGGPQQAYTVDNASVTVSGQSLGLGVCWSPHYDSRGLVVLGCGELGLASYVARTTEPGAKPRDSSLALLGNVGALVEAEYNLGPLQLAARLGGNAIVGSLEAHDSSNQRVFRSRPWEAFAAIGVGVHW